MQEIINLKNMEDIDKNNKCYNYKDVNFTFTYKKQSKYLVVGFHGLVYPRENIFFAQTKWNLQHIDNPEISILCIHDKFLEENRHLITTAFHDFENMNYEKLYIDIINNFVDFLKPQEVIFTGVSIGAIPALYYGCKFKSTIICLNSYIYLKDKDYDNIQEKFSHKIKKINMEENIIHNKNNIKKIVIYANKNDNAFFNDSKKFIKFCKDTICDKIKFVIHNDMTINNNGHSSFLPTGMTYEDVIMCVMKK